MNVKTVLLACALCASAPAPAANWVRVGATPTKGKAVPAARYFVDRDSIAKSGKLFKVWSLTAFGKEQTLDDTLRYQGLKALHLYSCEERTTTLKAHVYYADAMGKGTPLQNVKYEKFGPEDIVPDSAQDLALKLVCPAADPNAPAAPAAAPAAAKPAG